MRLLGLVCALLITTLCCSSSKADCPFPAASCPSGCGPIEAYETDPRTRASRTVVLGCTTVELITTDAVCYFEPATGRTVISSGSVGADMIGWRRCQEGDVPASAAPCTAIDAGSDAGTDGE